MDISKYYTNYNFTPIIQCYEYYTNYNSTPIIQYYEYYTNYNSTTIIPNFLESKLVQQTINKSPSYREALFGGAIQTTIDIIGGDFVRAFGTNPFAKTVFRDFLKLPRAIFDMGSEIGSSGLVHDEAGVYSAIVKALLKASIISVGSYSVKSSLETISITANYIAEMPATLMRIVSQERQKNAKNDVNLFEYMYKISSPSILSKALYQSFIKSLIADSVGKIFKILEYDAYYVFLKKNTQEYFISKLLGCNYNIDKSQTSFYSKLYYFYDYSGVYQSEDSYITTFSKVISKSFQDSPTRSSLLIFLATEFLVSFSLDVVKAVVFTATTRGPSEYASEVIEDILKNNFYKNAEDESSEFRPTTPSLSPQTCVEVNGECGIDSHKDYYLESEI